MASDFEEMMVPLLKATSDDEASQLVLDSWDHRRLEDAFLDVIESLPARRTRRLRAWIEQFEDFRTWLSFAKRGWWIEKKWRGPLPRKHDKLFLWIPKEEHEAYLELGESAGAAPIVAAAIGAFDIELADWGGHNPWRAAEDGGLGVEYAVRRGAW